MPVSSRRYKRKAAIAFGTAGDWVRSTWKPSTRSPRICNVPENSDASQAESQEEEMDSSTNPPHDFKRTPTQFDSTLGKRPIHSSLEWQEMGRFRSNRG